MSSPFSAVLPLNHRAPESSHTEKIQFAAGLQLIKSDETPIEVEALSPIEVSYIEKCKAMVDMYRSLTCACHKATHPNLKGLLSHLRSVKMWFPVFTCYNCMITFTDRSSSGKHLHKCPNKNLDTLVKLSNLKKRSALKTRIYQNYRCIKCRFVYSFHEDFCKHVDEDHCEEVASYNCTCQQNFDSLGDYKDHIYVSCMVEYYCDICNIAVRTLKEFINHAQHQHDNSEGFSLLQDDNYKRRTFHKIEPRENKEILGKRRSSTFGRAAVNEEDPVDEETLPKPAKIAKNSKNVPTKCLMCERWYSCQANMLRHYRTHLVEVKQETPENDAPNNSLYRCPDCISLHNTEDWAAHLKTHEQISCGECDKTFLFQTELEHHRTVHLNIKVYRDSKTDSYKTAMLNPNPICDVCNMVCENFEDLESHKLSHEDYEGVPLELSKYSCVTCNKHFSNYGEYNDHNIRLHADMQISNLAYPRKCDECDKIVTSGSAFASHKAMHKRAREECARIASPESSMEKPKSRKSETNQEDEDYHTCEKCFKVFSSKYNLKMHMKQHGINITTTGRSSKSPKKYSCDSCHKVFANNKALISHMEEEHEEMPDLEDFTQGPYIFTCDVCVQTFSNKAALIQHKSKHHSQEPGPSRKEMKNITYCKYCRIGFARTEDMETHLKTAHNEIPVPTKAPRLSNGKSYSCKICNKTFSSQPAMYAHQGWHKRTNNEGPLTPPVKKPISVAKRRAEFECNVCGLELPNDVALKIHNIEKHGNAAALLTPRCESCNQEFGTRTEYENHMKLHEIVENQKKQEQMQKASFCCQMCPASFNKSETLQAHVKISHPACPQEYKCPQCGRIFEKQASLTNHMKAHANQSIISSVSSKHLYSCSICNKGFNLPKDLRTHTITVHPF